MNPLTRSEQETIIRWAMDEPQVHIFTTQPVVKRKLERAGYTPSRRSRAYGKETGWFFVEPIGEFRWSVGKRKGRKLSEEAREAAGHRLKRAREARFPTKD